MFVASLRSFFKKKEGEGREEPNVRGEEAASGEGGKPRKCLDTLERVPTFRDSKEPEDC